MPTDDQDGKKTGDDAEKIWAAIRDQPVVPPNPDARNRALQAGLAAFDAIIEKKHQGFHSRVRLTSMMTHFFQTIGDLTMNTRTILSMAGVAAAVLLVVATVVAPPFNSESWHNPLAYLKNLQSSYEQTVKAESSAKPNLSWPLQEKNQPRSPQGSRVAPPPRSSQVADSPQSGQVAPLPQPSQVADSLQVADERPQRRREPLARMALVEAETVQKRAPMPAAAPPGKSDQTHLGTTGSVAGQRHRQYAGAPAQARQKTARFMSGRANHQKEERGAELFRFSPSQPHAIAESLPATEQMDADRDRFAAFETNPVRVTREHPVSTFSVDVDTAAYSFVRRLLNQGRMPPPDAVRVEEMINYFDYGYAAHDDLGQPFKPTVAMHPTPWNNHTRILHIGIKGFAPPVTEKPGRNLVFLLDVSGSMRSEDKLPLLKRSLLLLLDALDPKDTVAIAVYAGAAGTVLEPTPASEKGKIAAALAKLQSGGSTAGGAGIKLAYALAEGARINNGINRVILATDGDFNVGVSDHRSLKGYIARKRQSGIFLSVLGFGQGNYNDRLMQTLAQNGNGVAAYIDTLNEARKVLVHEADANLVTIAKDVKIQVEFNPDRVSEYRLIGYETRHLNRADFKNDQVDAGDIGSGHTVTALYEITLTGSKGALVEPLRYGGQPPKKENSSDGEYAFLKMRYKLPDGKTSRLLTRPITDADGVSDLQAVSHDFRFAAAVAAFGQKLRGGTHTGDFTYDGIRALAQGAKGEDPFGYRAEFVNLVRAAGSMDRSR